MTDVQQLREALLAELQKETLDSDRVTEIAAALAKTDGTRARFSVDAGMLARLGRELVARHETALSELVKNAYDADARMVVVRIAGRTHGDFIEVADDGTGMDKQAILDGFMRLATTEKIEHPFSPVHQRRRAGRKGVGRFAAERLGARLILTTATADANEALQLKINWNEFTPGRDLSLLSIPIQGVQKPRPQGTTLRIERLRDAWPEATIAKTFEHIAELIDLGDQTKSTSKSGAVFDVNFSINGKEHKVFNIRTQVANQAYATIEARVDKEGKVTWGIVCPALDILFADRSLHVGENESDRLADARNARLIAHYYLLQKEHFPATNFKTIQTYLARNGGLRLYRNGFRVLPYGEEGDDWLGLDLLSSQRSQTLAPVRNRNFLGTVSLEDDAGLFEETSSREGLIESPAFKELAQAMHAALLSGVREIDAERGRLGLKKRTGRQSSAKPTEQPSDRQSTEEIGRVLTGALKEIERGLRGAASASPNLKVALDTVVDAANEVVKRAQDTEALVAEIDLLRVLASMGLAIGQFTHEFSTLSGAMRASVAILLESDRNIDERREAARAVQTLLNQAREFTGLFKSMTEQNALRDRECLDLYGAITAFRAALRTILQRNGVSFEIEDDGDEVLSPPMHRSELFAILLNFTTNSIKAIKRAGRSGQILVRLSTRRGGGAIVQFCDNGDGIAEEVRTTLFDPFVTTTAARGVFASEDDNAIGSGLGLAIVRDIMTGAGGTAAIGVPPAGYATCMQLDLPAGRAS